MDSNQLKTILLKVIALFGGTIAALFFAIFVSHAAEAAILSVNPSSGSFNVGDTFTAGIYLDTQGETINAIETSLSFSPDKLQIVSPSSGNSIISIYTTPPRFNNLTGRLDIAGGITGGANVKSGLVATITFRVKSVGNASLRFLDNSKVLLHDGQGTNVLRNTIGGNYTLRLPPPEGPIVTSQTHPVEGKWYAVKTAILSWNADPSVTGYSYMISDSPTAVPDDVSEGNQTQTSYSSLPEGNQFFHIKALRDGIWGGVTHYALSIDTTAPADFPIDISPNIRTVVHQPYIKFDSTDTLSGLDHYEIKIVPLKITEEGGTFQEQSLFVEATSPYLPSILPFGSYDVIVRAYDKAGNYRDVAQHLDIVTQIYRFVGLKGISVKRNVTLSWWFLLLLLAIIVFGLTYLARHARRWHSKAPTGDIMPVLPTQLKEQLNELQAYRQRYGKLAVILCMLALPFMASNTKAQQGNSPVPVAPVQSVQQQPEQLDSQVVNPPSISAYSKEIYDEEIFYLGGRTEYPETNVVIHVQDQVDGQSYEFHTVSDKRADWFYRHTGFLSKGKYVMWVQAERGGAQSVPSAKVDMQVSSVAVQFGGTSFSLETIYLIALLSASGIIVLLIGYILFHWYHGRRKRQYFIEEIHRAEESIRRGFAVLKRDIEAELALIKRSQLSPEISAEERVREEELKRDLESIQGYVSKEIWDAEQYVGGKI
jgi:hypothetical protein